MKRIGALFLTLVIIAFSITGMWVYQSWKDGQERIGTKEIKNAYMVKVPGEKVTVYSADGKQEFRVKKDMKEQKYQGIADVSIHMGRVEKIICKPEKITGEVLAVGVETMDVENYGTLPLDANCSWYSVNGEVASSSRESLYIGQTDAQFVVAEGKICGVLLPGEKAKKTETTEDDKIRVIIKTDGFNGYEHAAVKLRGTGKLVVSQGKEKKEYLSGEEVEFTPESMKEKRVSITSADGGKIQILSVNRNSGNPLYRGKIELVKAQGGLHVINELPLEEYLYGVIPSEMPADYQPEALKAQAVCARSYAVQHIKNNRLREMGAHVDDSVSYQVYNNTGEDERCNLAVDETCGKKAVYDGKTASTYFFSTSCGVTASAKDVSFSTKDIPYLTGKLQQTNFEDESKKENARLVSDTFGEEELFRKFLGEDRDVLDKSQPWYRWSTSISLRDLENNINSKIGARCQAVGEKIQVRQPDGTYVPQQIDSIGTLKRIRIKARKSGGVAYMAVLVGSEATVRVYSEYNIRMLVFHENAVIRRNDGKSVSGMTMLPSGFFVLDKSGSSYEIKGGGFGHGTGMSQTGANELALAGKKYEEILRYYFDGIEVK